MRRAAHSMRRLLQKKQFVNSWPEAWQRCPLDCLLLFLSFLVVQILQRVEAMPTDKAVQFVKAHVVPASYPSVSGQRRGYSCCLLLAMFLSSKSTAGVSKRNLWNFQRFQRYHAGSAAHSHAPRWSLHAAGRDAQLLNRRACAGWGRRFRRWRSPTAGQPAGRTPRRSRPPSRTRWGRRWTSSTTGVSGTEWFSRLVGMHACGAQLLPATTLTPAPPPAALRRCPQPAPVGADRQQRRPHRSIRGGASGIPCGQGHCVCGARPHG